MTEPLQSPSDKTQTKLRFEWGNFLQGGLALYLLAILMLATSIPPIIRTLASPEQTQTSTVEADAPSEKPVAAVHSPAMYFIAGFGVIVLLMATGLTFAGDVGAALMLFQVRRGEKMRKPMSTVTVSSNRFMANEQVKLMPKEMRTVLLTLVHKGRKLEAIEYYRRETKTDPRFAANVVDQLQEFEERGLLKRLD